MESRLEQEIKDWREREQRYQSLFSSSPLARKKHDQQQLAHYEMLRAKFLSSNDQHDRLLLKRLLIEQRELERKLYPNLLFRWIRRAIVGRDIKYRSAKVVLQDYAQKEQVRNALRKAGLGAYAEQAIARMRHEGTEFSMPVAWKMPGTDRLDHHIQFKRDSEGHFQHQGYLAVLTGENGKRQQVQVDAGSGIQVSQAYNLLAGRPVLANGTWQQLDMNDKDPLGNCKIRHFPPDFNFDLRDKVEKLPLKNQGEINSIVQKLESGERVGVAMKVGNSTQDCFIEANPQWKSISLLDESGAKMDLHKDKERKGNVVAMKIDSEKKSQDKKRGRSLKM